MMNIGLISIWVALAASAAGAALSYLAGKSTGARQLLHALNARRAMILGLAALVIASANLLYGLFEHQFSYSYVAQYSSRSQPALYLLSAFWAGQEGTFLLWALLTSVMGFVFIRQNKNQDHFANAVIQGFVTFLGVLLVVKSPFNTTGTAPADGSGMNPLLQDFWMSIHPPILFIGYAATLFPFALAVSAMLRKDYENWNNKGFDWTIFASLALGTGIIIGGFWAYEVLGWGGFWGWDPVENSSLVPWLTLLALIHGWLIQRSNGGLSRTNLFLAASAFILVMYATFLTRSGVLADFSVHSFVDLGIGNYLLGGLAASILLGYGLFVIRARGVVSSKLNLSGVNRELTLLLSLFVLCIAAVFTLAGMSSPIITGLFMKKASQVETSFYNNVNMPVAIAMSLLLGVTPFLGWSGEKLSSLISRLSMPLALTGLALAITYVAGVHEPMEFVFVGTAAFGLISNVIVAFRQYKSGWTNLGGPIAHIGIGLLLIGVIGSGKFDRTATLVLKQEEPQSVQGYTFTFKGIANTESQKPTMKIEVTDGKDTYLSTPHLYYSEYNQSVMREPFIKILPLQDIYISPVDYKTPPPEAMHPTLELAKGQASDVGGYRIEFVRYETGQHMQSGGMAVGAVLNVSLNGKTQEVTPKMLINERGERTFEPASLPEVNMPGGPSVKPQITLDGMNVEEQKVVLGVNGLGEHTAASMAPSLTVQISTKPLMMVVWTGAVFIVLGTAIAFRRRIAS